METDGRGILFALPGSSCQQAAPALERIGHAAARRFPGVAQRWAYTSRGVRRKLAVQGRSVPDPGEALSALRGEGFTRVAVLSLHLTDGMEYGELAETVAACARGPEAFAHIALGAPLLTRAADVRRVCAALLAALPGPPNADERVVLVAHGSRDPQGQQTFGAAATLCREEYPRLRLGVMMGAPGLADLMKECQAAAVRKVWLLPFMVAAGYSAQEEIAGAGERSWKSAFEKSGIECLPVVKGLDECDGVVEVWMDELDRLLGELEQRR